MRVYEYNEDGCLHTLSVRFQYAGGETAMPKQRFYLATDVQALAARCILRVEEVLNTSQNERASYAGYAKRQAGYDALIADDEALLTELRAIVEGK